MLTSYVKKIEQVLVEIVKLVQKRGLKGTEGGWKDFLNTYDKKLGSSLSDPLRRSNGCLVSFLKTFTKENELKVIHSSIFRGVHCILFINQGLRMFGFFCMLAAF